MIELRAKECFQSESRTVQTNAFIEKNLPYYLTHFHTSTTQLNYVTAASNGALLSAESKCCILYLCTIPSRLLFAFFQSPLCYANPPIEVFNHTLVVDNVGVILQDQLGVDLVVIEVLAAVQVHMMRLRIKMILLMEVQWPQCRHTGISEGPHSSCWIITPLREMPVLVLVLIAVSVLAVIRTVISHRRSIRVLVG